MSKAPNEKIREAEKMYLKGTPLVEIAKKLEVSDGTVRSWKSRYGWGNNPKKNKSNVAKKSATKSATLQKKKSGGQPGNLNAVGNRGNPVQPDNTKHGGYVPVYLDVLEAEEKAMFPEIATDPEQQLIEEIQLYSIRERRIMQAIAKYRDQKGDVAVEDMTRYDNKRTFATAEEEEEYKRRQALKVKAGEKLPGEPYSVETHTTNKDMIVARLEQELSTVQGKKNKAIDSLYKLRLEKAKIESESIGSAAVDDWIAGILGGDGE